MTPCVGLVIRESDSDEPDGEPESSQEVVEIKAKLEEQEVK